MTHDGLSGDTMANARTTRPGLTAQRLAILLHRAWDRHARHYATLVPGTAIGAIVLLMLFGSTLTRGVGVAHIVLLGLLALAAILRIAFPPTAQGAIASWLRLSDLVIPPLAAVNVVAAGMGVDASLVFPLVLAVVTWSAAALDRRGLLLAVGFAATCELARVLGRGAWFGSLDELVLHLAFLGGFAYGGFALLRHEVTATRRRVEADAALELKKMAEEAHRLQVDPTVGVAAESTAQRLDRAKKLLDDVLTLAKTAVPAHSIVLMTRAAPKTLVVARAQTPESDRLTTEPQNVQQGMLGVLHHAVAEGNQVHVRIPVDGRALPYLTETPARIKHALLVAVGSERDPMQGALFFDRTTDDGFGDGEVALAELVAHVLYRVLAMERGLAQSDQRTEALDRVMAATARIGAASSADVVAREVAESFRMLVPSRFVALVVIEPDTGRARVAEALGEGADGARGRFLDGKPSATTAVLRTPTALPINRRWQSALGTLVAQGVGPTLLEGDPVVVLPLLCRDVLVGAVCLVAKEAIDDKVTDQLVGLTLQAAAAVERSLAMGSLEAAATSDPLTGLDNKRAVLAHLDQTLARARRVTGGEAAVLLIDVDHFTQVNDTQGHPIGDRVLKAVAQVIGGIKRVNDAAGRYGGEEFLLVLESTGDDGARKVAERLRERIELLEHHGRTGPFRITASIGFAVFGRDGKGAEDLLKKADDALYQAKRAGRNQVFGAKDTLIRHTDGGSVVLDEDDLESVD